jgi:hemolysin III
MKVKRYADATGATRSRRLREPVSGLTHLAGGVLAVAGLVVLLATSAGEGVAVRASLGVYGLSLVVLYFASALYHLLPLSPTGTARLRRLDHAAIFSLIAGTYTPICLIALDGLWRWGLLALVWVLALCGASIELLRTSARRWLTVALYLGLGWIAVLAAPALLGALPPGAILWLLAGGVTYSLGAVVYALKRPDPYPGIFGFHEIWHLFVLAGSACHFWAVSRYVATLV